MKTLITLVRWTARILGSAIFLLVLFFFLAEGFPSWSSLTSQEQAMLVMEFVMMAGVLLAWKCESVGGGVAVAGFILFWIFAGGWPGAYFAVFALSGLLFLIAWWLGMKPKFAEKP